MTVLQPVVLDLADAREPALAGGKAVNLAELLRAGFAVPDGFCVGTPAYAQAAGRVIVTQDRDFTRLHRQGLSHCGIAYSEHGMRSIRQIIEALIICVAVYVARGKSTR